jgi:hypothetical protein
VEQMLLFFGLVSVALGVTVESGIYSKFPMVFLQQKLHPM